MLNNNNIDRKDFWDKKIVPWENSKYNKIEGFLTSIFDVNSSLKNRLQTAEQFLEQNVKGKRIIEIGCGSARLMPFILAQGAEHYTGIDISQVALDIAQKRAQELQISDKVTLIQGDLYEIQEITGDLCFSLGLLDWINIESLPSVIAKFPCKHFFHSFSEYQFSFSQILHRLYVYLRYGHRTVTYVPKYYSRQNMNEIFTNIYHVPIEFYSSPKLSFGCFLYHLPAVKLPL